MKGLSFITLKILKEGCLKKIKRHLVKELLNSKLKENTRNFLISYSKGSIGFYLKS